MNNSPSRLSEIKRSNNEGEIDTRKKKLDKATKWDKFRKKRLDIIDAYIY